jgi:hypothetical protein
LSDAAKTFNSEGNERPRAERRPVPSGEVDATLDEVHGEALPEGVAVDAPSQSRGCVICSEGIVGVIMTRMYNYRGDFEVHLTVRSVSTLDVFRAWCEAERCKCVRIVLARGMQVEQPMATWRRDDTVLPDVLAEATERAQDLERAGVAVVRVKIEADPSNDDVPTSDSAALLQGSCNYFEHHVKVRREAAAGYELLLRACLDHAAHLSRNAWRKAAEGFEERFVTLRSYRMGRFASEQQLQRLLAALEGAGEQIIDVESEYTVHDSNLALDAGWLPHDAP